MKTTPFLLLKRSILGLLIAAIAVSLLGLAAQPGKAQTISTEMRPCKADWVGDGPPPYRFYNVNGTHSTTFVTGEVIYSIGSAPMCRNPSSATFTTPNLPGVATVLASNVSPRYYTGSIKSDGDTTHISKTCQKVGPNQYVFSKNQAFTISTPGSYSISFANGNGTVVELTIVNGTPPTPFSLNLTSSMGNLIQPATPVSFTATSQNLPTSLNNDLNTYTWYVNKNKITSATSSVTAASATYSTTGLSPGDVFQASLYPACGVLDTYYTNSFTVCTPPTLTITPNPSLTVATGQSATLTASGADAYLWSTGETTASISASVTGSYSVTGVTGGCSATATAAVSLTGSPSGPDLTATLTLPDAQFPNTSGAFKDFIMSIFEVGGMPTSAGNIVLTLTAPVGYTLAFDTGATSVSVSGGSQTSVNNGDWQSSLGQEGRQLSLTIKSGHSIGAHGQSVVGVRMVRTSASSGSTSNITVNVSNDASKTYDLNPANNVYARIISGL